MKNKLKMRDFFLKITGWESDVYQNKVTFFCKDDPFSKRDICEILDNYKAFKKPGLECKKKIGKRIKLEELVEILHYYKCDNPDFLDYEIIFFDAQNVVYYVNEIFLHHNCCAICLDTMMSNEEYEEYKALIVRKGRCEYQIKVIAEESFGIFGY